MISFFKKHIIILTFYIRTFPAAELTAFWTGPDCGSQHAEIDMDECREGGGRELSNRSDFNYCVSGKTA